MKGGYFIPAIPFFLLLSARYLLRYQFQIMCVAMIVSSFFVCIDSADRQWSPDPSQMSLIIHQHERSMVINFLRAIIAAGDTITQKSVIVAGSWLPYINQDTPGALPESESPDYTLCRNNIQYIDMMNNELLTRIQKQGLKIYYLSRVEDFNLKVLGIDLKKEGAVGFMPGKM
jgi:hypothetical protein